MSPRHAGDWRLRMQHECNGLMFNNSPSPQSCGSNFGLLMRLERWALASRTISDNTCNSSRSGARDAVPPTFGTCGSWLQLPANFCIPHHACLADNSHTAALVPHSLCPLLEKGNCTMERFRRCRTLERNGAHKIFKCSRAAAKRLKPAVGHLHKLLKSSFSRAVIARPGEPTSGAPAQFPE